MEPAASPRSTTPPAPSPDAARYDAFVSYSHAVDGRLAPALQRGLHAMGRPWYRLRALHVFRDSTSLSATPALWSSIVQALETSRYFILFCSPAAAQSPWVAREVQWWQEHRSSSTLLLAVTEGELVWVGEAGDFDWTRTTCLPRVLAGHFPEEPLWVDLRWARNHEHTSLRDPRFRDAVADLAAPLWGRPKDELLGEDLRQHKRTKRLASAALVSLVLLALLASVAGVVALQQRDQARTQRDLARLQSRVATARQLLAQADSARETDPRTALLLGIAAHRFHPDGSTQSGLVRTLSTNRYAGTLTGHEEAVDSVAFSPDGRTLASAGTGEAPLLWDVSDRTRPPLRGHRLAGKSAAEGPVAFAPDGNVLATSDGDGSRVILWDVSEPRRPVRLGASPKTNAGWLSLSFSPDGKILAAASADRVIVLDVSHPDRPTPVVRLRPARAPVAISPDGTTLVTTTADGNMVLWDLSVLRRPVRLGDAITGYSDVVNDVAFSPDGKTIATCGFFEDDVTLWDVSDRRKPTRLGQPLTGHTDTVFGIEFSPDGRTLASGSGDNSTILWDVSDLNAPSNREVLGGHAELVGDVAFAPDGKTLATASSDHTVVLWDLWGRGRPIRLGPVLTSAAAGDRFGSVDSLAVSPRGQALAIGSTTARVPREPSRHIVLLVDLSDRAHPRRVGSPLTGHVKQVAAMAYSSDGRVLATGSSDSTMLWNVADPARPTREAALPGSPATSAVAFAPDGRTLATGDEDKHVYLWDWSDPARPRRLAAPLSGHSGGVTTVAFSSDGKTLASGSVDQKVILWDVSDPAHPSRLGRALAGHTNGLNTVSFATDGRTLATAGADGKVILWDVSRPARAFRLGRSLETHAFIVFNPALFLPGRYVLLTGGSDGTETLLWDVSDPVRPVQLWRLTGHRLFTTAVAVADNAELVATGSLEGQILLWDLADFNALYDQAVRRACGLTGRGLDREEWVRFLPGVGYRETCPH